MLSQLVRVSLSLALGTPWGGVCVLSPALSPALSTVPGDITIISELSK